MAWINKKGYGFFLCFITGIISGVILTISAFTALISNHLDEQYKEIALLKNMIEEKDIQLNKLEESINTELFVLKEIEIILSSDDSTEEDDIDFIEIKKAINEKYSVLLGKEVKYIDGDLISGLVDKRILNINNKKYQLKVSKLILTDILKVWIEVKILEE